MLLVVTNLLSAGCNMKIHKDYSFTEPVIDYGVGSIHAKLRGTMRKTDDGGSTAGSPYEMLIWFAVNEQDKVYDCSVVLNAITLINVTSSTAISTNTKASADFKLKRDGSHVASIIAKDLDLEYEEHKLEFMYSFTGVCNAGQFNATATFVFKKNYEEREISFWDTLMGV